MDLRDYITILRERWSLVLVCMLTGTLAGGLLTLVTSPTYESTSQIYVSVQTQDGSTQNLAQGSTFSQSQVAGFADLATSPLVLNPIIDERGLDVAAASLAGRVSAVVKQGTSLIDVTVEAGDPVEAADLSNAVAGSMAVVLPELQRPLDSAVSPVRITVTRNAVEPMSQASPNARLNLAVGLLAGVFLGIGIAVLRTTLDTRIRSEGDVGAVTDRPVLGAVAYDPSATADPLVIASNPLSLRAEAIRRLRTNLQFLDASARPRSIVVTSSLPGEGKSTTAANLALAMADAGSRVLLIDADLRRPTISKLFAIEGAVGLTTVLIGRASLEDVVQTYGDSTLDLLASGETPPNPSELLGSRQMRTLLGELVERYDVVVLDTAPLLPVTDGAVLARQADGALVVAGANVAHRPQLQTAVAALETVEARVLGIVMNRVPVEKRGSYSYYEYTPVKQKGRR
ncbi:polysaccharide biosynthesis tyrosine autokinase [Litorihabitans aurantiacus]|uniref:non-specific protein-tyrosine kinase n=1 Tax=Litorihabitans aurantiacus TaxID=1930061 RepID=A0AA37UJP6_9MICO|nr:polysaccharide biosynthesis tyrosine autokinase [Litorihabitans aurantiacus]GMA30385.1 chromosome partitioning protein [Litorihabitans aurantiacus]